ncbi:MAG: hypothetical protein NZM28_06665 [Fimbriimonadales bacterium]|nr:hypothetical protein [Fimbriimonadales bacterium]
MPEIQVNLSEEEYRCLNDWARGQGQTVEAWLRDNLRALVQRRTEAQARTQAFLEWVQRYASSETPVVPLEALRRESLYQETEP